MHDTKNSLKAITLLDFWSSSREEDLYDIRMKRFAFEAKETGIDSDDEIKQQSGLQPYLA